MSCVANHEWGALADLPSSHDVGIGADIGKALGNAVRMTNDAVLEQTGYGMENRVGVLCLIISSKAVMYVTIVR